MNIKEDIKILIENTVNGLYQDYRSCGNLDINVSVEKPKEASHGDYSTNIALAIAKKLHKDPREVSTAIIAKIENTDVIKEIGIEKVEAAGPGFINFYFSKEFFARNIKEILKNKKFGANNSLKGKKVVVEYTDPNPFKRIHIGHLMPNAIGESVARTFEFHGATVKRVNYQGDVGMHVAKAVWAMQNGIDLKDAYAYGHKAYEQDEGQRHEMLAINKKIYERSDKAINKLYDQGRKQSLAHFEDIYKILGTKFDRYFFESEVADAGKEIVLDGLKKGIFEKGEKGAIIFKGDHTRVFINSDGLATYEAKDLALPMAKYKYFKYDISVIITANEQDSYFKVMLEALQKVNSDLANKTKHINHGLLRLPSGKMSSRTGTIIPVESFIEQVKKTIKEKIGERDLKDADMGKIALAAIKYSILKQSIGSDIIFDFNKSISFEGDSGPYLQYSYARAMSVLRKAKSEKIKIPTNYEFNRITNNEIGGLEKMMIYFPEAVEKAGEKYEPHVVVLYLTELAREFNNYYANNKIVDKADKLSSYKVALTKAFSIIMEKGLWLLGILAPEKM